MLNRIKSRRAANAPLVVQNYGGDGKYEAAQSSRARRRTRVVLKREDSHLPQGDRDRLHTATADLERNTVTPGWMIRKHLDFVAEHNFDCSTPDKTLNQDVEGMVEEWSEAEAFDVREKLPLEDHIRTDEALATICGDVFLQKLRDGRVQAIEADLVRDPPDAYSDRWQNGVLENAAGKATHYAIWKRAKGNGFEFDRIIPAEKIYQHAWRKRHDQARGISPISASVNSLRDSGKAQGYALAKVKLEQLFGLQIKREDPDSNEIDLTGDGPFVAEVGLDESIDAISSDNPSQSFQEFMKWVTSLSLKSLDLPYSFFDEAYTNFFGSKMAFDVYLRACKPKRRNVQRCLKHLTAWHLNYRVAEGRLRLPRSIDLPTLFRFCSWIPDGLRWWNPSQEISAAEKQIKLKLRSRAEIRRETHGDSWFDLIERMRDEEQHMRENGFDSDGNFVGVQES